MTSAYLLVAHGSRDPRPQAALDRLAGIVREQLQMADGLRTTAQSRHSHSLSMTGLSLATSSIRHTQPILLETAILECGPLPLHEQIAQFAPQLISAKITDLQIVPLFLLPGVHVMEDIPAEVEMAQQSLSQMDRPLKIAIRPHLGTHPRMVNLLEQQSPRQATGRIL
ncbi:MAG: CbiX/SirB N-terminal domain-containing protein, partial [Leptolyngbyaceae cyanobacterium bins.59]|nr:CbiX/SirB N-terminal domain-containing protein [Leptolyngbyaceae cyanobacterium bins.59]